MTRIEPENQQEQPHHPSGVTLEDGPAFRQEPEPRAESPISTTAVSPVPQMDSSLKKTNSLNRSAGSSGRYRRGGASAGGLARAAHANVKRESLSGPGGGEGTIEGYPQYYGGNRGVQLSDRPM